MEVPQTWRPLLDDHRHHAKTPGVGTVVEEAWAVIRTSIGREAEEAQGKVDVMTQAIGSRVLTEMILEPSTWPS